MTAFRKHHVTTTDGDRVIVRRRGEWLGDTEVVVAIKEPEKPMNTWRARRLLVAIEEGLAAVPR